ncbi:T9SS type A sorting domain-containing protein [bacterium]|nr:T9SS type A sorting domain-containing protein [bacterium]
MKQISTLICLSLLMTAAAFGQTTIPAGPVSGNWDVAGSPYLIQGEIQIDAGASLQIDAGVEVIFAGHYKFLVQGILTADGTAEDSIRFTAADPQIGWHGLRFVSAQNGSQLTYCIIEDGIASGEQQDNSGGGVYCFISHPVFADCSIRNNTAGFGGGGIYMHENSAPVFTDCDVIDNYSGDSGGGITITVNSAPTLDGCLIADNSAGRCGGGVAIGWDSEPLLTGCTIAGNTSIYFGGGIDCDYSDPIITGCMITNNSTGVLGGGIDADYSDPVIEYSAIHSNSSGLNSGGFDFWYCNPVINRCVISGNTTLSYGGAGSAWFTDLTLINSIVDHNGGNNAIYLNNNTASTLSYNDFYLNSGNNVVGNIVPAGFGILSTVNANDDSCDAYHNIFLDPIFAAYNNQDFRVLWASPCIDAGNPDAQYDDADGTIADMGRYYFDQSKPVNAMLLPVNPPINIPSSGGSINYTVWLTNVTATSQSISAWFDLTLPDGTTTNPILGPAPLTLPGNFAISRTRIQNISGAYPDGIIQFNVRALAGLDTSSDSFPFTKGAAAQAGGWEATAISGEEAVLPSEYSLHQNYPNPFNPVTTISYQLPNAAQISLKVYDIAGREVAELVNGYQAAGAYEMLFDASGLASGSYIYRLKTTDFSVSRQMVLIK